MNKYMKIITRISIAIIALVIVWWAIMQNPVEPQQPILPQGAQAPLYNPPTGST